MKCKYSLGFYYRFRQYIYRHTRVSFILDIKYIQISDRSGVVIYYNKLTEEFR